MVRADHHGPRRSVRRQCDAGVHLVDLAEKFHDKSRGRPLVDRFRRTLLDDPSAIHYEHPVGQKHRLVLVVRDEDRRHADPRLDLLQFETHLVAPPGVEVGERLVKQQDFGIANERPSQGDPLLLATGEQGGRAVMQAFETEALQDRHHLVADLCRRKPSPPQRKGNILEHIHMGPDRVRLEHHAHPSLVGRQVNALLDRRHEPVANVYLARIGALQARDHAQRRSLAAAARSEKGQYRSALDLKAHIVNNRHIAEDLPQTYHTDGCHQLPCPNLV